MKRKRIHKPTISTKCLFMKGIKTLQEAVNEMAADKQKLNRDKKNGFKPFDYLCWKWKYAPVNGIIKIML